MRSKKITLSGWGCLKWVPCALFRPERAGEVPATLLEAAASTLIARGAGRGYGDAATNKGVVVLSEKLDRFIKFDEKTGLLTAQAGVRLTDLLETFLHKGWVLPVMPGTAHVTLGGCVAADVHGKDHRAGTFGRWVESLTLHTAGGERLTCSPSENIELFRATIGGMGLTGFIEEVSVRLTKIQSTSVDVTCMPFQSVEEALQLFEKYDADHAYVAAWLDILGGKKGGRGWLQVADPATDGVFTPFAACALEKPLFKLLKPFFPLGGWVLNRWTLSLFNAAIYYSTGKGWRRKMELPAFFFPLDGIDQWNRLYGKKGFYQYQCVVPEAVATKTIPALIRAVRKAGCGSFFTTLKRFTETNSPGLLSFPMPGMTLAMDFPAAQKGLPELFKRLTTLVEEAGGRVYLAKDAVLTPENFAVMYPAWREFTDIKKAYDPEGKVSSSLYRRLMAPLLAGENGEERAA